MSRSGEHRGFVIEAFFKINDSVTATQRGFPSVRYCEQAKFSVLGRE